MRRGYAHVVVDVRGTGGSQGDWDSFGPNEQRDGAEMVRVGAQAAVEQRQGRRLRPVVHGDHAAHDRRAPPEGR